MTISLGGVRTGFPNGSKLRYFALVFMIVVGFVAAWVGRYSMNPDGMCYLDLGDATWSGRWSDAVNAYWSPLYAWLLGAALHVVKPTNHREFPLVHAVNFIIYLLALVSFELFLGSLLVDLRQDTAKGSITGSAPLAEWSTKLPCWATETGRTGHVLAGSESSQPSWDRILRVSGPPAHSKKRKSSRFSPTVGPGWL